MRESHAEELMGEQPNFEWFCWTPVKINLAISISLSLRSLGRSSRSSSLSQQCAAAQRAAVGTLRFRLWVSKKEQHDAAAPNLGTVTMGPVRPRCCRCLFYEHYYATIMCLPQYASFTSPELVFWREKSGRVSEIQKWIYSTAEASASTFVFFSFQTAPAAADFAPASLSISQESIVSCETQQLAHQPAAQPACHCANYRSAICTSP